MLSFTGNIVVHIPMWPSFKLLCYLWTQNECLQTVHSDLYSHGNFSNKLCWPNERFSSHKCLCSMISYFCLMLLTKLPDEQIHNVYMWGNLVSLYSTTWFLLIYSFVCSVLSNQFLGHSFTTYNHVTIGVLHSIMEIGCGRELCLFENAHIICIIGIEDGLTLRWM